MLDKNQGLSKSTCRVEGELKGNVHPTCSGARLWSSKKYPMLGESFILLKNYRVCVFPDKRKSFSCILSITCRPELFSPGMICELLNGLHKCLRTEKKIYYSGLRYISNGMQYKINTCLIRNQQKLTLRPLTFIKITF